MCIFLCETEHSTVQQSCLLSSHHHCILHHEDKSIYQKLFSKPFMFKSSNLIFWTKIGYPQTDNIPLWCPNISVGDPFPNGGVTMVSEMDQEVSGAFPVDT